MKGASVLVTGASGFLGRWTVEPLLELGAEVHLVGRCARPRLDERVRWHVADLHDAASVDAMMARVRPSHLLHLAWYVAPGLYLTSPDNLAWVSTTLALADAFVRHGGRRLVVSGTSAEYRAGHEACIEGRTSIAPTTLYATSKRAVCDVLERWSEQVGVSTGWGRVFFLYGPGEAPERLVPQLIRAGLAGRPFAMRHPEQLRDYMHVSDAARALVALLASDVSGPVNIASGYPVRLAQIAEEIGAAIGQALDLECLAPSVDPQPVVVADTTRLRMEVGFEPRYPLRQGLQATVEWWRAQAHARV